jgi:taurine dioxygenase
LKASICARSSRRLRESIGVADFSPLFRDQELTDDDPVAFSRRPGVLDEAPVETDSGSSRHRDLRGLDVVKEGVVISLGSGEMWHTDRRIFRPAEAARSCLEVPPSGGDTSSVDVCA